MMMPSLNNVFRCGTALLVLASASAPGQPPAPSSPGSRGGDSPSTPSPSKSTATVTPVPRDFPVLVSLGTAMCTLASGTDLNAVPSSATRWPVYHAFGGKDVAIPVSWLEVPGGPPAELSAGLVLDASPFAAATSVKPTCTRSNTPRKHGALAEGTINFAAPVVQKPTRFVLGVVARTAPGDPWRVVGDLRITLYPKKAAAEALRRRITQNTGGELAVFGPSRGLRTYLAAAEVPFRDLGEELPVQFRLPRGSIVLGSAPVAEPVPGRPGRSSQTSQILPGSQASAPDTPPGVRLLLVLPVQENALVPLSQIISPNSIVVHTDAPLLDSLPDTPLAQEWLNEMLGKLLGHSPGNGDGSGQE